MLFHGRSSVGWWDQALNSRDYQAFLCTGWERALGHSGLVNQCGLSGDRADALLLELGRSGQLREMRPGVFRHEPKGGDRPITGPTGHAACLTKGTQQNSGRYALLPQTALVDWCDGGRRPVSHRFALRVLSSQQLLDRLWEAFPDTPVGHASPDHPETFALAVEDARKQFVAGFSGRRFLIEHRVGAFTELALKVEIDALVTAPGRHQAVMVNALARGIQLLTERDTATLARQALQFGDFLEMAYTISCGAGADAHERTFADVEANLNERNWVLPLEIAGRISAGSQWRAPQAS